MKRVVSISLGSSKRNHETTINTQGQDIAIERIGTNGSIAGAIELIKKLDGSVSAFGMGGIDLRVVSAGKSYFFRDGRRIAKHAIRTPIVDGSGLKNTLERRIIQYLNQNGMPFRNKKILLVSSVDRFGMAEALSELEVEMVLGDLMFGLGIKIPIRTLAGMNRLAKITLPIVTQLPFTWLYPTGSQQELQKPKFEEYYQWADIIAGDFLYIRRHLPNLLKDKVILTNTLTGEDLEELRSRKVATVITTTPDMNGRSYGTNVMEATIIAISGKNPNEMTPTDYDQWIDRIAWKPRIEVLQ